MFKSLKSHLPPKPFYLIFFLEFWERFGFYGVQAIIVIYMIGHLNYSDKDADILFTSFNALVYLLPCVGGYIGDNVLGSKRTTLFGASILGAGYLLLSMASILKISIFFPLSLIAVGNGFFKANPSSLLSQIYKKHQLNPDSGFTLYYMAINIGAFISMSITPFIYKHWGWSYAFFLCFLGLVFGGISFLIGRKTIENIGSPPDFKPITIKTLLHLVLLSIVLIASTYWFIKHSTVMLYLLIIGASGFILLFIYQMVKADSFEKKGMLLFLILFFQAILFFVLYFQAPTSLTLYAVRNVNPYIFGIPIHPASFQALVPFWIIVASPILAVLYQYLASKNKDISMPAKFALGTILAGSGFLILPLGGMFANVQGIVSSNWLVLSYLLQGIGELLISALGLSLVARYIPQRLMGFTMGLWFLGTSIGSRLAGIVASSADVSTGITSSLESLAIYNALFLKIGLTAVIFGFIMIIFVPTLKKIAGNNRF